MTHNVYAERHSEAGNFQLGVPASSVPAAVDLEPPTTILEPPTAIPQHAFSVSSGVRFLEYILHACSSVVVRHFRHRFAENDADKAMLSYARNC